MTSPLPIIRPAEISDHDQWAALYRAYRATAKLTPAEAVIERVWSWITDPGHSVDAYVAIIDDRHVGFAHYRRFARPILGDNGIYLDDLMTTPESRGQGVGTAFLRRLADLAKDEGLSVVRWTTAEGNEQARRLYDSMAHVSTSVTYNLTPLEPSLTDKCLQTQQCDFPS